MFMMDQERQQGKHFKGNFWLQSLLSIFVLVKSSIFSFYHISYRKKQESLKALFGRNVHDGPRETARKALPREFPDAVIIERFCYQPSSPIDIPLPTAPPAYSDPCFPAIQENHLKIWTPTRSILCSKGALGLFIVLIKEKHIFFVKFYNIERMKNFTLTSNLKSTRKIMQTTVHKVENKLTRFLIFSFT